MEKIVIPTTLCATIGDNREYVGAAVRLWFESLSISWKQRDHYEIHLSLPECQACFFGLPPHTYTCTCICLCVNTNKMLITRRLSALPAERADYLLDSYKSCHLKYCWNMLVPFNMEKGTKNVKIRM